MKKNLVKFLIASWVVILVSVYLVDKEKSVAVVLKNDSIKVVVDSEKSGRLMYIGSLEKNYLVVNEVEETESWKNYGGSYLWIAPQHKWPGGWPPPSSLDGEPWTVLYSDKESVVVRSPEYKGLLLERKITINDQKIFVENVIYNNSDSDKDWGLWSISQVPMNSKVEFKNSLKELTAFSYPPSVNVGALKKADVLTVAEESANGEGYSVAFNTIPKDNDGNFFRYKLGAVSNSDFIKIVTPKGVLYKSIYQSNSNKNIYPHNCNVEVYTEGHYVEVETLSDVVTLKPGEKHLFKTTFIVEEEK